MILRLDTRISVIISIWNLEQTLPAVEAFAEYLRLVVEFWHTRFGILSEKTWSIQIKLSNVILLATKG